MDSGGLRGDKHRKSTSGRSKGYGSDGKVRPLALHYMSGFAWRRKKRKVETDRRGKEGVRGGGEGKREENRKRQSGRGPDRGERHGVSLDRSFSTSTNEGWYTWDKRQPYSCISENISVREARCCGVANMDTLLRHVLTRREAWGNCKRTNEGISQG
jgi:hypothetical protein